MKLEGKIINFLGDSITEGCGVTDCQNRYDNLMLKKYGIKEVHNYGVGGTRYAYQIKPTLYCPECDLYFCGRMRKMDVNADIVVVFGGVNDYLHGDAPFGTEVDTTPETFCGALNYLMDFLSKTYKMVVVVTPAHCYIDNKYPDSKPSPGNNRPLSDYVKAIENTADRYQIPCLNIFKKLPINLDDETIRNTFTADGIHFNDAGHRILAELLADFIISIKN